MPYRLGGIARTALPSAVATGKDIPLYVDANGRLVVTLGTLIAGEDQTNNVMKVSGGAAAGTAATGNPTLMGITDGTNLRALKGNTDGTLPVGGFAPAAPTCTFTRPANTTAYTIGDEVGTAGTAPTTIPVGRVNGGGGLIQGAQVLYSSYPAVVPSLVLLVFSATVTLAGDNAQLNLSDAHAALLVCSIPLTASQSTQYSAGAAVSAGGVWLAGSPNRPAPHFVTGASEQTLYCALITLNAFTPIANSETLQVWLDVELN